MPIVPTYLKINRFVSQKVTSKYKKKLVLKVPTYIYIVEIVSVCDCADFRIVASLLQSSFQTVLLH